MEETAHYHRVRKASISKRKKKAGTQADKGETCKRIAIPCQAGFREADISLQGLLNATPSLKHPLKQSLECQNDYT